MTQSTINAQAGTTISPTLLNKSGGDVDNFAFQTNGANAISINQIQLVVFNSTGASTIPRGTTAERPANPVNGMLRYNTTLNRLEGYANGLWGVTDPVYPPTNTAAPVVSGTAESGATISVTDGTWTNSPTSYAYQWYANSVAITSNATANTFTLTSSEAGQNVSCVVTASNFAGNASASSNEIGPVVDEIIATYLVVAGGGGGGGWGGGGGAGGVLSNTVTLTQSTTYTITVGGGGSAGTGGYPYNHGGSGSNSSALGVTCIGGGYGGSYQDQNASSGDSGGSGGGAGIGENNVGSPGSGTSGQGYAGGTAASQASGQGAGGGGGGASQAGFNNNAYVGGNGGNGITVTITGSATSYGGGGGGHTWGQNGGSSGANSTGGTGGGGYGGNYVGSRAAASGTPYTGGGGGSAYGGSGQTCGAGGSGVVIISLPTSKFSNSYTGSNVIVSTTGANTVMIFSASGSYTA